MITYLAVRIGELLVKFMPVSLANLLFGFGGDIAWFLLRNKRAAACENMARVLGSTQTREASAVARETFRNYGRYIADFLRFPSMTEKDIARSIHFSHWEHLDAAAARGKGVIFVSLHLGAWDLAAAALAQRYPLHVVVDFVQTGQVDRYVQRKRADKGIKIIPYQEAARGSLKALRNRELLGLLIDRPTPDGGVVVNFFGAPVAVPAGPAKLALKTGATLVTGALVRTGAGQHYGDIDRQLEFVPSGNTPEDVRGLTQVIMKSLEKYALAHPEQLIMFRRFWLSDAPARLSPEPSPAV